MAGGMPLAFTQEDFLVSDCYRPHPKNGEGNSFTLFVSSHPGGYLPWLVGGYVLWPGSDGGVPHPWLGYLPHLDLDGGYPGQVKTERYLGQVQIGIPWPGPDREGTPARSRQGDTPSLARLAPPPHLDLDRGYPIPGQGTPPPIWTWTGWLPWPGQDGGYPSQVQTGGYPIPGQGTPCLDLDGGWGTPPTRI